MSSVLLQGNSLEVLKDIPDNSIDAVVTDPPYGLSFMGKKWDYDVPSAELWREVLRVLKPTGRFPANIILDEEAAAALDEQVSKTMKMHSAGNRKESNITAGKSIFGIGDKGARNPAIVGDMGIGASRFFYCAKASKSERNAGLEGEVKQGARPNSADSSGKFPDHDHRETGGNNHPTVKPVKLMEYLVKLITPVNGTVLDPFMGSGTTGVACKNLGFKFIGIDMSEEYVQIALKRINI